MSAIEYTELDLAKAAVSMYPLHAGMPRADVAKIIANEIATRHGLTVEEMLSRKQRQVYLDARRELYRALHFKGWSTSEIGDFAGGRDHTTVLYAIRGKRR